MKNISGQSPMWFDLFQANIGRTRCLVHCARLLLIVTLSQTIAPVTVLAQTGLIDREAKIKAAYIYKIIGYTTWPPEAFPTESAPLIIGTIGDDPVNKYLRQIAGGRTAGKRKLVYRKIRTPADAKGCHLIFVSDKSDAKTVKTVNLANRGQPVLMVGETPGFAGKTGVIGFRVANNRVLLQLSLKAAAARKLRISSQLARVAEIVDRPEQPAEPSQESAAGTKEAK